MQIDADILTKLAKRQPGDPRSMRDEMLEKFLAKINPGRERAGYKPYTIVSIATKLKRAGIKPEHFAALYKQCAEARSFGALFEYVLKSKV